MPLSLLCALWGFLPWHVARRMPSGPAELDRRVPSGPAELDDFSVYLRSQALRTMSVRSAAQDGKQFLEHVPKTGFRNASLKLLFWNMFKKLESLPLDAAVTFSLPLYGISSFYVPR